MTSTAPNSAPTYAFDVTLRDGSTVHVRPVTVDDRDAIAGLLNSMSPDSLYFRGCGQVNTDWFAASIGGAVALKATAPGLLHKSDAGGVLLGLRGSRAVAAGARKIRRSVSTAGYEVDGFVVQRMAPSGVELLVGVVHDPSFGPVVACGAGGTTAGLLKDVSVRITPLTDLDASELVRSLRTFPLLDGYRGAPRPVGAL